MENWRDEANARIKQHRLKNFSVQLLIMRASPLLVSQCGCTVDQPSSLHGCQKYLEDAKMAASIGNGLKSIVIPLLMKTV